MTRLWGYEAKLILRDERGREVEIEDWLLPGDGLGEAPMLDADHVYRVMQSAELRGFGF